MLRWIGILPHIIKSKFEFFSLYDSAENVSNGRLGTSSTATLMGSPESGAFSPGYALFSCYSFSRFLCKTCLIGGTNGALGKVGHLYEEYQGFRLARTIGPTSLVYLHTFRGIILLAVHVLAFLMLSRLDL